MRAALQLSGLVPCSLITMKTFLQILLGAVLLVVAIKISPILFVAALVGLIAAAVLGAVGLSLLVAFIAVAIAFALALAPIWVPVLCIIGLVSLYRRHNQTPPAPTPTANVPPPVAA